MSRGHGRGSNWNELRLESRVKVCRVAEAITHSSYAFTNAEPGSAHMTCSRDCIGVDLVDGDTELVQWAGIEPDKGNSPPSLPRQPQVCRDPGPGLLIFSAVHLVGHEADLIGVHRGDHDTAGYEHAGERSGKVQVEELSDAIDPHPERRQPTHGVKGLSRNQGRSQTSAG